MNDAQVQPIVEEINSWAITDFFIHPNPLRSVIILFLSIIVAFWLSKIVANFIILVAQKVATRSDNESNTLKSIKLRQVETYLGITVAAVRAFIAIVVGYITWRLISPEGSEQLGGSGAAAIGASAAFIVIGGQTVGTILRDITAGATMIAEQWFKVGDHVKIEPFWDLSGVVERLTLRSTKVRRLSGETVWIHNQQIQAVHVLPSGVRSITVNIFVNNDQAGEKLVKSVTSNLPTGPMMLAQPMKVRKTEKWGDNLWLISVDGKTVPGREWLIEQHFVSVLIKKNGKLSAKGTIITETPIVIYDDPETSKRFRRAVRVQHEAQ